jgi:hypothetical protein
MKKISLFLLALATCVWAADFWQTKPYTEWTDKETQRIETNSPWSKQVPLSIGGGGGGPDTSRGKRGAGGVDSETGMGVGSSSRPNQKEVDSGGQSGGGAPQVIYVSWRSALAFRQAVAKAKFGDEAATSADAKKMVDEEPKFYLIMISGLSGRALRNGDKMKESLIQNTSLIVKGKDPIQATDVQTGGNEQRPVVVFVFPRTTPFTLDDKDVEFSTKLGSIVVKQKFHLKDMVLNGKLDL